MKGQPRGPSPSRVLRSTWRAGRRRPPRPSGTGAFDHGSLKPILASVATDGIRGAAPLRGALAEYRASLRTADPDLLSRDEALAFWINLYNAEVLETALEARDTGLDSLLRERDVFDRPRVEIAGEMLSLDDIEHGKVRRFGDPRVHAVLTCASVSCPTLPGEPVRGTGLHESLDAAMRDFLREGGAVVDHDSNEVRLSRIFLWYGADFVYPESMPRWRPVLRRSLVQSLGAWLSPADSRWLAEARPRIRFQPYDWSLSCRVAQSPDASTMSAGIDTRTTPRKSPTA